MYRISLLFIIGLLIIGILMGFLFLKAFSDSLFVSIFGMIFSFFIIGYSIYLLRKRNEGIGFYWDEEGIVIDLKGNKVYWDEIEEIKFFKSSTTNMRSTVIYPHYTNHEKIRIRLKKLLPTPEHSIAWILIEKPKDYHKNLIKVWEEKRSCLN
jgi:hypothetical protein